MYNRTRNSKKRMPRLPRHTQAMHVTQTASCALPICPIQCRGASHIIQYWHRDRLLLSRLATFIHYIRQIPTHPTAPSFSPHLLTNIPTPDSFTSFPPLAVSFFFFFK